MNFRVIKEKGIQVSKPSHEPATVLCRAGATRTRPRVANGSSARAARLAGLLVIGLLALLMVVPAFASATVPAHQFKEVFGSLAQPELNKPAGMATDPATGDVYVIDLEAQTLHRYKPNGEPDPFSALGTSNVIDGATGADEVPVFKEILSAEGIGTKNVQVAVAPPGSAGGTEGEIYVTNAGDGQIDIFSPTGAFIGSYVDGASPSYLCGVSVGPGGEVYVGDRENGIHKLIPSAPDSFAEAAGSPFSAAEVCNVAAGYGPSAGSVFYTSWGQNVFKLDASTGALDYQVFEGNVLGGMSIDPVTGHLYVGTEGTVEEFDVSGASASAQISATVFEAEIYGTAIDPGSGALYVTSGEHQKVEVFDPLTKSLNIAITGSGGVECEGHGAGSFGPCASSYGEGRTVKLKATVGAGSSFGGWSEFSGSGTVATPCVGAVAECEVKFDADVGGKVTFVANPKVPLTVEKSGAGSGTISSVPGGIECGLTCEAEYEGGAIVTLEATAASGSTFVEWTGCDSVSGTVCHVTVEAAKAVDAVFAIAQRSLTVTKAGTGGGTVTCNGGTCAANYPQGALLTLTATPDTNSTFAGWTGAGCSGTGNCTLTVNADTAVTATFDKKPTEATPPPPPPRPKPSVGEAHVSGSTLRVTANVASVKLTCSNAGPCKGVLKLYASVSSGKHKVTKLIGESSFSIKQGASTAIKVKITNAAIKRALNKGHTTKAQVKGTDVSSSTLTLKPAGKRHSAGGKH